MDLRYGPSVHHSVARAERNGVWVWVLRGGGGCKHLMVHSISLSGRLTTASPAD